MIKDAEYHFAFDLEGTMIDLEELHQQAFENAASDLGVTFGPEEFHNFVGAGDVAISKAIVQLLGENPPDYQLVRAAKQNVYGDILQSQRIEARDGVPEYLDSARSASGRLVVVTLTPRNKAQLILRESKLQPFFEHFIFEEDVKKLKPAPDAYVRAAALLSTQNMHMLVHEDSQPGVASAKSAGSPVVAFPVHEGLAFQPEPDAIYMSWNGLNPQEIASKLINN